MAERMEINITGAHGISQKLSRFGELRDGYR
jgi:hypothetical protein